MIIYLYGPDSYRRREKINEYVERYRGKYSVSSEVFYLDKNEDWERFKNFCKSMSLFEASKLGVVFNYADLNKSELKEFISLIKENLENKDITLIINNEKKPTKDFSFLLKKPAISHDFENLEGAELNKFVDLEIKKRGIELDPKSRELLVVSCGQNLCNLISELDKLSFLDEKKIDIKVLERHIDLLPEIDVFSQLNKIRTSHSVGERLKFLEDLLRRGVDPAMIFNISAASPYLTKEQKIEMANYDVAIKSGKLEYEEVLLSMMLG